MNAHSRRRFGRKLPYGFRLGIILVLAIACWGLVLWVLDATF
jgi:hypothetical protein